MNINIIKQKWFTFKYYKKENGKINNFVSINLIIFTNEKKRGILPP